MTFKKILLFRQNKEKALMANLSLFKYWVFKGIFYDEFVKKLNDKYSRDEVKEIMFGVLFSKNICYKNNKAFIPYKKEKELFESVFPEIYKIIKILKEKNNSILPIYLQKIESYLFIDCIAKKLVSEGIVPLTIHDSVIVESKDQIKALSIMRNVFHEKLGFIPTFHINKLKNETVLKKG